jgi:Spi protease inhibitor
VIVSGDDTLTPVVGYSANTPFSGQRIPDALKAWLDDYARYVVDVQAGKAPSYLRDISRTDNVAIEPMVT